MIYAPLWWATRAVDDQLWEGQHMSRDLWILSTTGSPAPTFWSFVLGHDNLSPVEQQRHWLEDTVCLELIRFKDGSIVSISKISEVIMSKCSSFMSWNLQLYNNSFEWKIYLTFTGGQTYPDPLHIFRGSGPPDPSIYAPGLYRVWFMTKYTVLFYLSYLSDVSTCTFARYDRKRINQQQCQSPESILRVELRTRRRVLLQIHVHRLLAGARPGWPVFSLARCRYLRRGRYSFIHHLLRQLAATYKYTVKYSCTINYIYNTIGLHTDKHIMQEHIKGPYSEILQ